MAQVETLTIAQVAKAMGKSELFIRLGLQRKDLDFGYAVKTGAKNYTYFINKAIFEEKTGCKV